MLRPSGAAIRRPRLLGLATAVPDQHLPLPLVIDIARAVLPHRQADFDRIEAMFHNTGIDKRHSAVPVAWFLEPQDWPARTRAYLHGASELYRRVVCAALADSGLEPDRIDTVITVSTTGIATPSLEARLLPELGFRQDVRRVPVFGLGCAGGVGGLSLAARLALAAPDEHVLVVAIELCTLAFRLDDLTTKNIVAAALFGDGAAAAVVSCRGEGLAEIDQFAEQTWPDTLDLMGWTVDPVGFGVVLSAAVPAFVEKALPPAADAFLAGHGLAMTDIAHLVFHPGGAKVIAAIEAGLGLQTGTLRRERDILRDYGNMSSPTVLFVLRRALDEGVRGRGLMAALGPGFTASLMTYETA